jgi:hypothetical protein
MPNRAKEASDLCDWELANFFVNETPGNKTEAYKLWCAAHKKPLPSQVRKCAFAMFAKPSVQKYIEELREENRKNYAHMRDNNIANLTAIATDPSVKKSDRIAATKELNSMFGYSAANVNLNAQIDTNVVVEVV